MPSGLIHVPRLGDALIEAEGISSCGERLACCHSGPERKTGSVPAAMSPRRMVFPIGSSIGEISCARMGQKDPERTVVDDNPEGN